MTKKEALTPQSLVFMFEDILRVSGHAHFQDSKDWRECKYTCHVDWLKPLLDSGCIIETRSSPASKEGQDRGDRGQFNYHQYAVTSAGMKWWLAEYTKDLLLRLRQACIEVPDKTSAYFKLIEMRGDRPSQLDGKGIGAVLRYDYFWGEAPIAMAGIEDGYFEFVDFYAYPRAMGTEKYVTVRLTDKGFQFFGSLPRLELECA